MTDWWKVDRRYWKSKLWWQQSTEILGFSTENSRLSCLELEQKVTRLKDFTKPSIFRSLVMWIALAHHLSGSLLSGNSEHYPKAASRAIGFLKIWIQPAPDSWLWTGTDMYETFLSLWIVFSTHAIWEDKTHLKLNYCGVLVTYVSSLCVCLILIGYQHREPCFPFHLRFPLLQILQQPDNLNDSLS